MLILSPEEDEDALDITYTRLLGTLKLELCDCSSTRKVTGFTRCVTVEEGAPRLSCT